MINLIEIASGGRFQSGQLVDEHNLRSTSNIPWNGRDSDNRGFIRPIPRALCEGGDRKNVLQMHPKWVSNGSIKAWLPWRRLPANAVFRAKIGFLQGATGTDGVTFQVWEHHNSRGREVWNRVINHKKTYGGGLTYIEADLSHLSNQNVGIELRVDAGKSSGRDWAVWAEPIIESRTATERAHIWTFDPRSLTVHNRNETRRIQGRGDEPYLAGIYFRSIFGKPGTTKVTKLDDLRTLGSNVRAGRTVPVPDNAGMAISDTCVSWNNETTGFFNGIQIMGYALVAMEQDRRGKGTVRNTVNNISKKLFDALKEHIEENPLGIFNPEETLTSIEEDVFGGDGNRSVGDKIKKALGNALKWLARADDIIGQNQIVLVGLNERILQEQIGDDYNPDARENPIAAVTRRNFDLDFRGSDAHYSVRVSFDRSTEDILAR